MIKKTSLLLWITQTIKAMRLLSLTLAFGATSMGMAAAWRAGFLDIRLPHHLLLVVLITIAGLAIQCGANLINDFFEGSFKYQEPGSPVHMFLGRERTFFDIYIFLLGLAMLGLSGLIGLYLVWLTGPVMLIIGVVGLIGSYAYTGEPFVYKTKGLGVPLSFLLMGPLMTMGAWYPFARELSWYPILLGLPLSLLVPAMMISNEMRDFNRDVKLNMGTLATRIGSGPSKVIYLTCLSGLFLLTIIYAVTGLYPLISLSVLILLPMAIKAWQSIKAFEGLGIPRTNRLHLFYMILSLIWLILF
jgi:1,4-dihydroxy-2-naphthoate octaprenyltransferase